MILRNRLPKRSTTLYDVICGITDDNLTIQERFETARPLIFSLDYAVPNNVNKEEFKKYFETIFLYKYNEQWLAFETFEQWQLKCFSKLLSIMPTYSLLIDNTIYSSNTTLNDVTKYESESENDTDSNGKNNVSINNNSSRQNSTFPFNSLVTNNENLLYVESGAINKDNHTTLNNNENHSKTKTKTKTITTSGNSFTRTLEHNEKIKYIIDDLLNEFNSLFSFVMI